jgi:hypothetical protein
VIVADLRYASDIFTQSYSFDASLEENQIKNGLFKRTGRTKFDELTILTHETRLSATQDFYAMLKVALRWSRNEVHLEQQIWLF